MNTRDLFLVLIFGIAFGLLCVTNKKLSVSTSHPMKIVVFRCFLSLVLAILIFKWLTHAYPETSFSKLSSSDMKYSGIFVALTLLISWILMVLMKHNSSSSVTCACTASGLLFAVALSSFFLGEVHNSTEITGLFIVIAGISLLFKGAKQRE